MISTARTVDSELLRELGADEVIDYTSVRFEERVRDVDVVLDAVGGDTLNRSWQVLRRGGVLVTVVGPAPTDQAARYGVRGVYFIVTPSREELIGIADLIDVGKLRPIIEATYPLEKARDAFERALRGHNQGKLVLQVAEQDEVDAARAGANTSRVR